MDKYEVVIVGGGLAGLSAAYTLAQQGIEVLVLERGDYPGAKNMTGGRIYVKPIRNLFPDLWDKAPLERHISREKVSIMDRKRLVTLVYEGCELLEEPFQSYSMLRGKFDKWFAKQAQRKGAILVAKTKVDDLVIENGAVVGVVAGGEELRANVVIACDGVLSFISEKAGLRKTLEPKNYAVGFKEVIEIEQAILEERFNLEGNEGLAHLFMGDVTSGKFGGAFLYTNKDSLSLGIVMGLHSSLVDEGSNIVASELLNALKVRPEIAKLIRGGQTVEYSAHLIPEGGINGICRLYGDGILVAGDAGGFSMNIGVTVRGMEYAMATGYYAAQTVIKAKEKNDYTSMSLSSYEAMLNESFVMKDFKNFKSTPEVLANPRFYSHYPRLAGDLLKDIYQIPSEGAKDRLFSTVKKHLTFREMWALGKDLLEVRKI